MLGNYLSHDFRKSSLDLVLEGLEVSMDRLYKKQEEVVWYDIIWLLEETEPIIGIALITLQNYINSSIYDRYKKLDNRIEVYNKGMKLNDSGHSKIQLIIALANYYKHRDDDVSLYKNTTSVLNSFNLEYHKELEIDNSPIFKGFEILSETGKLSELNKMVSNWRKSLWEKD